MKILIIKIVKEDAAGAMECAGIAVGIRGKILTVIVTVTRTRTRTETRIAIVIGTRITKVDAGAALARIRTIKYLNAEY